METYASVLNIAIIFFFSLIVVEWVASLIMKKPVNRSLDTVSSLSSGVTNTVKDIIGLSIVIVSYQWMVEHFSLFTIESQLWLYATSFILIDFASYWSHRWNHEINVLWNRHIVHHSSEEFNLSCALRQSISGIVGIYFFLYVPMAIVGIPPKVIAIVAPLHLFAQFWYHTRLINKMGFLENIIVTPSHHRVHHAINDEYIDKNYAAIFIVWDKWFGTFQKELADVEPVYGVKKAVKTWNPIIINWMHAWQLIKDAWRTESWVDKLKIWVMPTGWRPKDLIEKYPLNITTDPYNREKYDSPAGPFLKSWFWIQLVFAILFQLHLMNNIATIGLENVIWYGLFIMLSVFAYTTLMDRHPLAIWVEIARLVFGLGVLYLAGGWFGSDAGLTILNVVILLYLISSFAIVCLYTLRDKSLKNDESLATINTE